MKFSLSDKGPPFGYSSLHYRSKPLTGEISGTPYSTGKSFQISSYSSNNYPESPVPQAKSDPKFWTSTVYLLNPRKLNGNRNMGFTAKPFKSLFIRCFTPLTESRSHFPSSMAEEVIQSKNPVVHPGKVSTTMPLSDPFEDNSFMVLQDRPDSSICTRPQSSLKNRTPLQQPVKRTPYNDIARTPISLESNCCNKCDGSGSSPRRYTREKFEGIRRETEFPLLDLRPKNSRIPKCWNGADNTPKRSAICPANGNKGNRRGNSRSESGHTPYVSEKETHSKVYIRNGSVASRPDSFISVPTIRMEDIETDGNMDIAIHSNGICMEGESDWIMWRESRKSP